MTTDPNNAPDRMTTVAEFQQRAGADQARANAVLAAMGQATMNAIAGIAQQTQMPPAVAVQAGFVACLQAAKQLAQQGGKSQQDIASFLDKMFNLGLNSEALHSRLGKRALELLAHGLLEDIDCLHHQTTDFGEKAKALVAEAQAMNGHGPGAPAPKPIEEPEVIVCGARLPREGSRCSLAPHSEGGHFDQVTGVSWEPGDA